MTKDKVRVAIVGVGHNGLSFCKDYMDNQNCILTAICDRNPERAKHAGESYGIPYYTDDRIYTNPEIDAISVHTSDNAHTEPFCLALENGKHVFVEKPMSDNEADLKRMVETARKYPDRVVLVGHVLRYNKYFALVKNWIQMGLLGDIVYMEGDYIHDLRYQKYMEPWKLDDEIPMLGGGCHPLDLLRWYADSEIDTVSAMSNRLAFPEMKHDASMSALYKFKSGAIAKVTALYGCNVTDHLSKYNLSVYGTKGTIVGDKVSFEGLYHQHMAIPNVAEAGHPYYPEVAHFIDCIQNGTKPIIGPEDAANVVLACLYAEKSANSGQVMGIPKL